MRAQKGRWQGRVDGRMGGSVARPRGGSHHRAGLLAASLLLSPLFAQATELERFSPQGSTRDPRQVTARFSGPMVPFGAPDLPAPFDIDCAAAGQGRWADGRTWVYDFAADLPAGLRCEFRPRSDLRDLGGGAVHAAPQTFDTGGPAIRRQLPGAYGGAIDENQLFLLMLDAPATRASVEAHGYCAVDHLAESLPLQLVEGQEREKLLALRRPLAYEYDAFLRGDDAIGGAQIGGASMARAEALIAVVRCARPLPPSTGVDLVWGAGIATPSGIGTTADQTLRFQTRPAFTARSSCERVNAAAACVPVLPLRLEFSAPVLRAQAARLRLETPDGRREPRLEPGDSPYVQQLEFPPPLPEQARLRLLLPPDLRDDAGRVLDNAASFPLEIDTDEAPPLAKFNGTFGIIEAGQGGVLPVSLRNLEDTVPAARIGGARKRIDSEADVLRWMQRVRQRMNSEWNGSYQPPGLRSVFDAADTAERFDLGKPLGAKAFEVVGLPLGGPGFYVVELASPKLGAALLNKPQPRYVATTALVTDLAVHFKWGRQGSLAFITRLSDGQPVPGAALRIVDGCDAAPRWSGSSAADGSARIDAGLPEPHSWSSCSSPDAHPLLVSARKDGDFSFTLTSWDEGISPWEFKLPSGAWATPEIAHTVLDRSLFRAGETVSMKHFLREHTAQGIVVPQDTPATLRIEHQGSGQGFELPLRFDASGIAESSWSIPPEAKLGEYRLAMTGSAGRHTLFSGSFRVEQYRLPLMRALLTPPTEPAVARAQLPLDIYVGYFSGGGAAALPVKLRTQLRPRSLRFAAYPDYRFDAETIREGVQELGGMDYFPDDQEEGDDGAAAQPSQTLPLTLDATGSARAEIPGLPTSGGAHKLVAELEYPDANGEIVSVRQETALWPAALVTGLSTEGWAGSSGTLRFTALALDLQGKPLRGQRIAVAAYERRTHSYRKRLVGGFYGYSHSREIRRLPASCSGRSNAQGLLHCKIEPGVSGEVLLEATARDGDGRLARATQSAWMAGKDEWWFAQGDSDRMDLIPEQREVEPGDKLRLQVRMPFRKATALVTVEREGVIDHFVTELSGRAPVVEVPIRDIHAPNVYVSVLALRPRVGEWRSRFNDYLRTLGLDRWLGEALRLDGARPTALVDLSKPAFRLGITRVDVGWKAQRLLVELRPEQDTYPTRGKARVQVQVRQASDGKPPAAGEIAFSAVDEALLDLHPNPSDRVLETMMRRRGIEVLTSTAQMQVVGKRHYGRKAMAPGGGGGRGAARELLDSLLLWQGRVPLDAEGRASIEVPLNDALSAFRLTAVASAGADRFGSGSASLRTTQDIQILSGLPPLVREHDRYAAVFTLRNTTQRAQAVVLSATVRAAGTDIPVLESRREVQVPPSAARPARFELLAPYAVPQLDWTLSASDPQGRPLDALTLSQQVLPAYPVRVWQATLLQPGKAAELPVQRPAGALPDRGGIRLGLNASLTGSLDSVRDWMRLYPYHCFEQSASRAVIQGDRAAWDTLMARAPGYLDGGGLLRYFPVSALDGSDTLTAYVLALSDASGWPIPDSERARMIGGLQDFVQGRGPQAEQLRWNREERLIAALSALSRHGALKPEWLGTVEIDPGLWPTVTVIDWLDLLRRMPVTAETAETGRLRAQALDTLRARLNFQGSTMGFSTEGEDGRWWLMGSGDANANRMILAVLEEASFQDELPRLLRGALARQRQGHWDLTTANAWGVLAVQAFAQRFERGIVTGTTTARLANETRSHAWTTAPQATLDLPWPATAAPLSLSHDGAGAPWALVQARAAVPLRAPFSSGYRIERHLEAVVQRLPGRWSLGDVARVRLDIDAQSDMGWVVVEDPVPAGSSLLGGGLGRDAQLLTQGAHGEGQVWPAYEERSFDAYRAYYAFVPKGRFSAEYTVRFNTAGRFEMPATHVQAMYAPEMLGALPNEAVNVEDGAP